MKIRTDNFTGVILEDGLIHDYEFERRIHYIAQNEDIREYSLKKSFVYTDYFNK
jgi:hypothetical protein